jgi:hypothetical protein
MGDTIVSPAERKQALEYRRHMDRDPAYQAILLRGLSGLLRAIDGDRLQELTNVPDVTLFLASTLDGVADTLDGGA